MRDRFDDLLKELGMDAAASLKVGDLKAPMPGLVVDIPVKEGDTVSKGDTLVILEAMKMENALKAVADATVKKIAVTKGQAVDKNTLLIQLG
jgi:biotin carboxyl carrier protein